MNSETKPINYSHASGGTNMNFAHLSNQSPRNPYYEKEKITEEEDD